MDKFYLNGKRKIYVASSWRNIFQPSIVLCLKKMGHEVYDFRNPKDGDKGFHWSEIDSDWEEVEHLNITKLQDRLSRDKIVGKGDKR